MKVNIKDLLDDYQPDQELDYLENDSKSINLNTVTRQVSKKIVRSKGGQLMHFNFKNKFAAACIVGITALTVGGITANAATNGALLNNVKVYLLHEDGTKEEIQANIVQSDEDGNKITEYSVEDQKGNDTSVSVKESADGSSTEIETDGDAVAGASVRGTLSRSEDGEIKEDKEIIVSEDKNTDPVLEDIGIDLEKYKNYAVGIYEETNSDGIAYEIVVAEDGSINVNRKE